MKISEAVYESLSYITGLSAEELSDIKDSDLFESGILDSLSFVQCITDVQENTGLNINITELDMTKCSTITELIDTLEELK